MQKTAMEKVSGDKRPNMAAAPGYVASHPKKVKGFKIGRADVHKTTGGRKCRNRVKQKRDCVEHNARPPQFG